MLGVLPGTSLVVRAAPRTQLLKLCWVAVCAGAVGLGGGAGNGPKP